MSAHILVIISYPFVLVEDPVRVIHNFYLAMMEKNLPLKNRLPNFHSFLLLEDRVQNLVLRLDCLFHMSSANHGRVRVLFLCDQNFTEEECFLSSCESKLK